MPSAVKEKLKIASGSENPSGGRRSGFSLFLRILCWQLLAIVVVEAALFAAGLGEEEIFKLDPDLGFKHMSYKKVTWRSEGFAGSYFNGDGLREPGLKIPKPAGTYRVALLGDSLTESLQVPIEKTFGYQTQEKLSRELGRPVQVINFGCSGYSTVQEYLQLKKQVLKYKPDLVLLCYNSRDCFENWSPPDEVLTNVRPAALHLPGAKLIVSTDPVHQWMKSPRARFLKQVEVLREHSRLWGLYSAAELDWSLHNEAYKRLVLFFTRPGKAIRLCYEDGRAEISKALSSLDRQLSSFSAKKVAVTENAVAVKAQVTPAAATDSKPDDHKVKGASVSAVKTPDASRLNYQQLVERTLGSLLLEMKTASAESGARLAVVALPVRSALSARQGMDTAFADFDYNDELKMLEAVCHDKSIPMIDLHSPAKGLSAQDRDYLFYLVHLTPRGHEFVSTQLSAQLKGFVSSGKAQ